MSEGRRRATHARVFYIVRHFHTPAGVVEARFYDTLTAEEAAELRERRGLPPGLELRPLPLGDERELRRMREIPIVAGSLRAPEFVDSTISRPDVVRASEALHWYRSQAAHTNRRGAAR